MITRTLASTLFATLFGVGLAFAQTPATTAPAPRPLAPMTTPGTTAPAAAPTTTPMATPAARPPRATTAALPAGTKVNLNTATAAELDALPGIGKARSKVIMTERAKSPFKDWADFDTRTAHTSVNKGVKAKIKDNATF